MHNGTVSTESAESRKKDAGGTRARELVKGLANGPRLPHTVREKREKREKRTEKREREKRDKREHGPSHRAKGIP